MTKDDLVLCRNSKRLLTCATIGHRVIVIMCGFIQIMYSYFRIYLNKEEVDKVLQYIVTFLPFIYELVDCNQTKNKYAFYYFHYLCATVQTYTRKQQ